MSVAGSILSLVSAAGLNKGAESREVEESETESPVVAAGAAAALLLLLVMVELEPQILFANELRALGKR